MNAPWTLAISENERPICTVEVPGPAELGRQSIPDEKVYSCRRVERRWRVVIASREASAVPRCFLLVEPQADASFRLTNLSNRPAELSNERKLQPGDSCLCESGVLIGAGNGLVLRAQKAAIVSALQGLDEASVPPGQGVLLRPPFASGHPTATASVEVQALLRWLRSTLDVLQSAATSSDFFDRAARALVDMVCLDSGRVLLRQGDDWKCQACYPEAPGHAAEQPVSHHILERVCRGKRTFWEVPDASLADAASMRGVTAVVAAPLLDRDGTVLGVLYGDRRAESSRASCPILEVEARLVELLAGGVAAGLARLEQEKKALAVQVQFEQFFSPELARHLARTPGWEKGRDIEVSVLFGDVRGFSRVSERLGPEATMSWIGDVMNELSICVQRHEGVLVDYVGDEVMAMWGAPGEQPDHAQRACRAALDMLACLPRLDARWQAKIGVPTAVGIGINTGMARVGNSGSQIKFKYGPLGNTVNLGSRVQGATKYLKCRLLITGTTQAKLDSTFARRRLCQVRVVNIVEPVALYELAAADRPGWAESIAEYDLALAEFEGQQFRESALRVAALRARQPGDGPALVLLSRAVNCMVEEPLAFDPVWVLPSK